MRARTVGIVTGLVIAIGIVILLVGIERAGPTGHAIAPTDAPNETITLPLNASSQKVVNANFTIDAGRVSPENLTIRAGTLVILSAYAATGPAKLVVPAAAVATPLLSDRQLRSFQFRINVPGSYEVLCTPCGAPNTLDTVNLTVT